MEQSALPAANLLFQLMEGHACLVAHFVAPAMLQMANAPHVCQEKNSSPMALANIVPIIHSMLIITQF